MKSLTRHTHGCPRASLRDSSSFSCSSFCSSRFSSSRFSSSNGSTFSTAQPVVGVIPTSSLPFPSVFHSFLVPSIHSSSLSSFLLFRRFVLTTLHLSSVLIILCFHILPLLRLSSFLSIL